MQGPGGDKTGATRARNPQAAPLQGADMGVLPERIKARLRRKEDGHDVIGITISLKTVKAVIRWIRGMHK